MCLHNECLRRKKLSDGSTNGSESESPKTSCNGFGDETPEEFPANDIIINVLDANNNCLNLMDVADEEPKPRVVTRTLFSRSDSQCSQTTQTKRVTYGGMFNRFVDAVDEMNKIVLIPSRLQDIDCADDVDIPVVLDGAGGCDMHSGFKLLNSFRNQIVHSSHNTTVSAGQGYDNHHNGHHSERSLSPKLVKQYSVNSEKGKEFLKDVSLDSGYTSIVNDSQSQSYSSTSSVNTEDDSSEVMSDMSDLALSFYHHLYGLNLVLEKLIDTTKFISNKYEQNLQ
ncbi:unnamed protein product [Oppiella nova]|uniref:Mid1-interacting protein n=1 Tax=Oppiella nova TaxID=334625 RepID=A0A7R9QQX4_9ACAR|nr:unnamed protein product [Oppiella nova]CAG2172197.1 unnamed protein product [Oppiella nova]